MAKKMQAAQAAAVEPVEAPATVETSTTTNNATLGVDAVTALTHEFGTPERVTLPGGKE